MTDTEQQTPRPTTTIPHSDVVAVFSERYGIRLAFFGEDGEVVLLGHDIPPRRAIAAINAEHREIIGETVAQLSGEPERFSVHIDLLRERWACQVPGPVGGDEAPYLRWTVDAHTPGAFPVTVWSPW